MRTPSSDAKRHAPAFERNHQPIGDVLATALPTQGLALEVAGGSGQHVLTFARRFPGLIWQPSDAETDACASIDAWASEGNASFHASLQARDPRWGIRDVAQVQEAAAARGFELEQRVPMPANNQSLILRRTARRGEPA